MKKLLLLILILGFVSKVHAQQGPPSGSCSAPQTGWVSTNFFYACNPFGQWVLVSGGSITGVVAGTGMSGGGTNGTITINGEVPNTVTAGGATIADRVVSLSQTKFGRAISAQNEDTGAMQDTGAVDFQTPNSVNTVFFGGGGSGGIRTCMGWHVGDRDRFIGDNVGKGGTGVSANTGTNFTTTSSFPTCQTSGGGLTMPATGSGVTSITLNLANPGAAGCGGSACPNLLIGPGEQLIITSGNGDSQVYTIKNCSATCATGSGTWYSIAPGGSQSINISPALAVTQVGTVNVGLIHPIWRLGEQVATSPQEALLANAFVNGDSMNGGTGVGIGLMDGAECQENCRFEDIYVRDTSQAIRIMGGHRSGTYRNLNVAYTNGAVGCPTPGNGVPGTVPMEIAPLNSTVDGFTLFIAVGGPCTPAQMTLGGIHITNNQFNSGLANQVLRITNWHVEMNGTNLGCGGTCNTGDGVLIDSTAGNIILDNGTLCPAASGCLNGVHIAATFNGTFYMTDVGCNASGGTGNWIKDDVNGNTLPCSANLTGTGFYSIALDGTVWTNVNCAALTKGYCYSSAGLGFFSGGTLQWRMSNAGVLTQYNALPTVGIGTPVAVASTAAGGVTISSNTSIGLTSLCSTTQCPAGLYKVHIFIDISSACTSTGTYIAWLAWTDGSGSHAGSSTTTFFPLNGQGTTPSSGTLALSAAGNFGQADFNLVTTGVANQALGSINYGTTATACGTGGPAAGKMFIVVTRIG